MDTFEYSARTKAGKIVQGNIAAVDKKSAADGLFDKNLTPISIESKKASLSTTSISKVLKLKKVPLTEKVIFSRQFATMIGAGVPIIKSISILSGQSSNATMKSALKNIGRQVEGGATLSSALAGYPTIFSPTYVSMVKAGEVGGILEEVLDRLATQMEKDHELIGKVKGAMIYPAVIFVVMGFAFFFIMTVIVPQLSAVFAQLGGELPWYTKLLLTISEVLTKYGVLVGIAVAALVVIFIRVRKKPAIKQKLDLLALHAPIFGNVILKVNVARFSRTFAALMGAGIPVLDALNVVAKSLSNSIIAGEVTGIAQAVKNGSTIAKPLAKSKYFPPIVSEMTSVGEETGTLDTILTKLAEFYEKEVNSIVAGISSIIEPVLILVLGSMVGFVVISVIGPLYQLTSSI